MENQNEEVVRLRCQRIGCNATFTEDDNPEGTCSYHDSPIFHDGMKEWSCCKKRSRDFSLFLEIPGCKTGKHTIEKPVLIKAVAPLKTPVSTPLTTLASSAPAKEFCSRCRQHFFCSDHRSQAKELNHSATTVPARSDEVAQVPPPVKKIVDIKEPQTCKNKGCGKTSKEKENHETSCSYHPGPAIFHDRMRVEVLRHSCEGI